MNRIYKYSELTLAGLRKLEPGRTVCLMAVSPLEVHGSHLPLGTDIMIAEKLQMEYCHAIQQRHPDFNLLLLPTLSAGSDPLPLEGSIAVGAKTLEKMLVAYVHSLSRLGFRYLIVCDNHGGPSHQMAMEIVARKAWRRHRFALINPFNVVYRKMVQHDQSFLQLVKLAPGKCGDDADAHAGTNETSLALSAGISPCAEYRHLPPAGIPKAAGLSALVGYAAAILGRFGLTGVKADLEHLKNILAWINSPSVPTYLGEPALADPEMGDRMIKGHVAVAMDLLETALAGEKPCTRPMLWWMRAFRR